jgi:hypothetical protein
MGVMACSRNSCESIMCDTHVEHVGYICPSCQDEFKQFLADMGFNPKTEGEIVRYLKTFMQTPKGEHSSKVVTVNDFFIENTR